MSHLLRRVAVAAAVALLLPSGADPAPQNEPLTPEAGDLLEIPEPNFEGADPSVAEAILQQIENARKLTADELILPMELAQAYGELGQTLLLYDLLDPAEVAFRNVLTVVPDDHRAHYYLGVITQELRRLDEATAHFEAVVEKDPRYLSALIRLGDIERLANRPERAKEWYERALEVFPAAPAAHWGLGQLAASASDPQKAVEHFEAVLEAQPEASAAHYPLALAYRELGQMDKAREHLALRGERSVQPLDPLVDGLVQRVAGASMYMTRGNQAFSRGKYEMAAEAYGQAVQADPDNTTARHALATTLSRMGRMAEAAEHLELVIEQEPDNGVAHYNLGTMYSQLSDPTRALKHYQRAVEISPDLANARFNLGMLLEQFGRYDEALEQYTEARALDPQDTGAAVRHSELLARLGRADQAESELNEILTVNPSDLEARMALGATLAASGRLPDGLAQYRQVVEIAEDSQTKARAHFEMGKLLLAAGNGAEAIAELEATVELVPRIVEPRLTLANTLARAGRFEDAAAQFDVLVELQPRELSGHMSRAIALLLARQDARAKVSLEESLGTLPGEPELVHLLTRLLAASEDPAVRDGQRALQLAQRVLRRQPTPQHEETTAMALAELGRFDEAREIQNQVLRRARQAGAPDIATIERRLRLYESGQPVRSPWLSEGR